MSNDAPACPRCGGRLVLEEDGAFATCASCGSRLHLGEEEAVGHQMLVPVLSDEEARASLSRWLRDREVTADPREVASGLVWFPFFLLPGSAVVPAAPLLASNLASFKLPAGDRKAFDAGAARGGEVVPASVRPESLDLPDEARASVRLLHVPFRRVRFALFDRSYEVWFDAASGQPLDFSLPPTSERRLDVTYAVLATLLFAVAAYGVRCLFGGFGATWVRGAVVLAVAGPLFWLVAWAVIRLSEAR